MARKKRRGKRQNVNRSLTTQDWLFTITRTLVFKDWQAFDTAFSGFVISNVSENFLGFTLAQTSQFAALTAVYDQFCVWNVGVKISYPTSFGNPGTFSYQLAFAYDPDGGTETPANIYARRTVQIHPLNSIMYPEVNLGTFILGHLSNDIVVQYRYWYDIATFSS